MRTFYFLVFLMFTGALQAQIVNIPDANFKAKLLESSPVSPIARDLLGDQVAIDVNSDGEIQVSEALAIGSLNIDGPAGINSVTGIEAFVNLVSLNFEQNPITTIDVAALGSLISLSVNSTQLAAIDLSGNPMLQSVSLTFNLLTTLDFGLCPLLETAYLSFNELTSINVSQCPLLNYIDCDNNNLTSLDLTGCAALTTFSLASNNGLSLNVSGLLNLTNIDAIALGAINVVGCAGLVQLNCPIGDISSINLTGCGALINLYIQNNALTTLDVSPCPNLQRLRANSNSLTNIDISGCDKLTEIEVYGNQLTSFDASGCPLLQGISVMDNPLLYLFIKNGSIEGIVDVTITDLLYICADEGQVAAVSAQINGGGGSIPVNSYCSFTPGGDYNTISGLIRFDANGNGCGDGDSVMPLIRIDINDGTNEGATVTNGAGIYTCYTGAGNFSLTPQIENPTFFNFSATTAPVTFPTDDNLVQTQDFCITANGVHPDVEIVLIPQSTAQPGFDAAYRVVIRNKGNQTQSGSFTVTFDDLVLDFVSASTNPDVQSTGSLTWNYSGLIPFENRAMTFILNVNGPTEIPPVNIDDELLFSATINPITGDEFPVDNTFGMKQVVIGSLDPNNKVCLEGDVVSSEGIGEYLHYVINFENTGTAPATNIVVKDAINESMFDVSSLQIMNSSHPVNLRLTGNVAEFIFEGINLGIGGHGNILLKIKTKDNLAIGSEVSNQADIFFDYNYPILTNEARTAFESLGIGDPSGHASIAIYPNPAHDVVHVKADENITSVQLFDVQGRLLQARLVNETQATLDISRQQSGVYFMKVFSDKGQMTQKIIKK